jgi:hypothetical protein
VNWIEADMGLIGRLYAKLEKLYVGTLVPKVDASRTVLDVTPDGTPAGGVFDHNLWDAILKANVSRGDVDGIECNLLDYDAVLEDERFEAYKTKLASADVPSLAPNEQLALFINAYNCLCVNHIVTHAAKNATDAPTWPASINDLSIRKSSIFDAPAGTVGGESVTLNHIEHSILRVRWKEPRVHASIVCASASCPDLRSEAFTGSKLNAQMDSQCTTWLSNSQKGVGITNTGAPLLSRVFLWFQEDFEAVAPSPIEWAIRFLPDDHPAQTTSASAEFLPYSWKLNRKAPASS